MLRDWGAEKKYQHVLKGYNFRLEGIQGAVLRVKLRHLEALDRSAARRGARATTSCLPAAACATPTAMPYARHVYHVYAIRTAERAGMAGSAARRRDPDRHPLPDPGPSAAGVCRSGLSERASSRIPSGRRTRCCRCRCLPELTEGQIAIVGESIRSLARAARSSASVDAALRPAVSRNLTGCISAVMQYSKLRRLGSKFDDQVQAWHGRCMLPLDTDDRSNRCLGSGRAPVKY